MTEVFVLQILKMSDQPIIRSQYFFRGATNILTHSYIWGPCPVLLPVHMYICKLYTIIIPQVENHGAIWWWLPIHPLVHGSNPLSAASSKLLDRSLKFNETFTFKKKSIVSAHFLFYIWIGLLCLQMNILTIIGGWGSFCDLSAHNDTFGVFIPPTRFAGVYSDPYFRPFICSFVRPSVPISNPLLL